MRLKSGSVSYGRRERGQPSAPPSPLEFKVQNNRSVGLPLMQRFWFGRRLILAENASVFPATSLVTVSSLALDKKALLFLPNCSQLGAEDCVEFQTIPFVPVSGWLLITQGLVSLELPALASSQPRPLKHLLAVPKRWPSKGTKPATSFQASGSGQSEILMGSPQFGGCDGLRSHSTGAELVLEYICLCLFLGRCCMNDIQKFYRFHQGCLSLTLTASGGEKLPPALVSFAWLLLDPSSGLT